MQNRTHHCNELRMADCGKTVQLSGWMDIFEILRVTHGLMMVNVAYVFWGIRGELRLADSDIVRRFRLPLYIVITFALAELVAYYFRDFRDFPKNILNRFAEAVLRPDGAEGFVLRFRLSSQLFRLDQR